MAKEFANGTFWVALLSMSFIASSRTLAVPVYTVLDLGTVNSANTTGRAVNNAGKVAGFSTPQGSETAFRTSPNTAINPATDLLGTLGGNYSQAHAMNDSGQVVGLSAITTSRFHAFRTTASGGIIAGSDLGTLAGSNALSVALGINASGQVVGWSDSTNGSFPPIRAFRTAANQPINPLTDNLGTLGGSYSEARDINTSGQVVGYARITGDAVYHAFRTGANLAINVATDDLGTLGGSNSIGWAINDSGVVVGEAQTTGDVGWRAFKTGPNMPIVATNSLGTFGGLHSRAKDINTSGTYVVGFSDLPDGSTHGFIHDGVSMRDLNSLIDPASGWVVIEAWSINDNCQITGTGTIGVGGTKHALLLTPVGGVCPLPDFCPDDPAKTDPGQCGCGISDADTDGDGRADCADGCVNDPNKITPGQCGCGVPDTDSDNDEVADCNDLCPDTPPGSIVDATGCTIGVAADFDKDGDVDADDFAHFQSCATRATVPQTIASCQDTDLDKDGDTDMDDFAIYQRCYSGAGILADLNCGE